MRVWGFIPARGGSKNMQEVCGRPLIDYCIDGALKAKGLEKLVVNSDDQEILRYTSLRVGLGYLRGLDVEGPDTPIDDVVRDYLKGAKALPQAICLIQPTSPFFKPHHIDVLIRMLDDEDHEGANSAQTICKVPHNYHAWNQRSLNVGRTNDIEFCFPDLRATGYNKQHKPEMWKFGNLVVTRVDALLKGETFFAQPSVGFPIGWKEALDVDTEDDFELMRMILTEWDGE